MAFEFRQTVNGKGIPAALDYPIDVSYSNPAIGDVVKLTASKTIARAASGDTAVLGVLVGTNFMDLNVPPTVGRVMLDPNAMYEADVVNGTPTLGTEYGLDDSSNLDVSDTTNVIAKVVKIVSKPDGTTGYYVTITHRQLV